MRIIACLAASLAVATAAPLLVAPPINGHVTLSWGYDTNELSTNLTFNIYETTNLANAVTNWNCLTNVIGTNLSVAVNVDPGAHFFVVTASNFWGETSITSNLTSTPPVAIPINASLRIEKSP